MRVYFDNASTTPLLPEVKEAMHDVVDNIYGNPSSIHELGRRSRILIEDARTLIATGLKASTGEIFFTSGATESNNMALRGSVRDLGVKRIISSPTEHHCILHCLEYIEKMGLAEIQYLDVDNKGHIDYDQLEGLLDQSDTKTLVSLMHANNEIGTIHDIERISHICLNRSALFHCDTAQTVGKLALDLNANRLSFMSGSAHKFFGPKGAGFIYVNSDNIIKALIHGGDQERGMRSGTENIYGIAGMAKAFELSQSELKHRHEYTKGIRDYLMQRLEESLQDIQFNGDPENGLYNILSVSFPASDKAEMLMMNLDIAGVCASSGSACSSGVENDSHVLQHIGHKPGRKTVRFSFSHLNSKEEIDFLINHLGKLSPLSS